MLFTFIGKTKFHTLLEYKCDNERNFVSQEIQVFEEHKV